MKLGNARRLAREDLSDAPPGEWLDKALEVINQSNEQTTQALQQNLTFADNTTSGLVTYRLTHGVPLTVKNPLKVRPSAIEVGRTIAIAGTTRPRCMYVDWEFADGDDPKAPSQIKITPYFDLTNGGGVGDIGERIGSIVLRGSAVVIATATAKDVTSISVTPGVWDLTGIAGFKGLTTSSNIMAEITTTSNAAPSSAIEGDNLFEQNVLSANDGHIAIPNWRQAVTATTTYYLTAYAAFTASASPGAYGRLSAVRAMQYNPAPQADVVLFFNGG